MFALLFSLGMGLVSTQAIAAPTENALSETQVLSASLLGQDIADWLSQLEPAPNSVAIFDVREKSPLTPHFSILLETELLSKLKESGKMEILSCLRCRAARATVMDDQLVITRGAPDLEEFKKIAQEMNVEAFVLIEARRAATSTVASANLYSGSGNLLAARTFSQQVLDLDGSAAMLGLVGAIGAGIGGRQSESESPSGAATAFLLQDLGNARKGGLAVGGWGGNGGGGGFAMPTMAWRQRNVVGNLMGMFMLGVGPAASNKGYGLAARVGYELFLGFCAFGAEAVAMAPFNEREGRESADAVIGVNIGIVFGR